MQIKTINTSVHPRLFFTELDLPILRDKISTTHQTIYNRAYRVAELALDKPIIDTPPADAPLNFYRLNSEYLFTQAFVCVVGENKAFCEQAIERLISYVNWDRWGETQKPELAFSHMLMGTSLAYDWLYNLLSDEQRELVQKQLVNRAYEMYIASSEEGATWWQASYFQNHFSTANASLGIASLAIIGDVTAPICKISPISANVNLRTGPSLNNGVSNVLQMGETATIISATNVDGYTWYLLDNELYVRSDVVYELNDCTLNSALPETWLNQAISQVELDQYVLNQIQDGSWHESIPYQSYKLTMSLPFWVNLRELTGVDILPHTYLQNYSKWMLYNWLPNGDFILSYGDFERNWETAYAPHSLVRFTAQEYDDNVAAWMGDRLEQTSDFNNSAWSVFEFFYYDESLPATPPVEMPLSYEAKDLGSVIWRTGWDDDDLVFGFKAQNLGGRFGVDSFVKREFPWGPDCQISGCQLNIDHNHNDSGSFYLVQGDTWLATEVVGLGLKDNSFHNVIQIDEQQQYQPPVNNFGMIPADFIDRSGYLKNVVNGLAFNALSADLTNSYRHISGIQKVSRHVVFARSGYIIIFDDIVSTQPHSYEWFSHFEGQTFYNAPWIESYPGDQIVGINVFNSDDVDVEIKEGEVYTAVVNSLQPQNNWQVGTLIYPSNYEEWDKQPIVTLLEDDGQTILIRIDMFDGNYEDIYLNYLDQPITIGNYNTDASLLIVSRNILDEVVNVFASANNCLHEDLLIPVSVCE